MKLSPLQQVLIGIIFTAMLVHGFIKSCTTPYPKPTPKSPIVIFYSTDSVYHRRVADTVKQLCSEHYPNLQVKEYMPIRLGDATSLPMVCRCVLDEFPQAIIVVGSWCSSYLIQRARKYKQDTPIIFVGVDKPVERGFVQSLDEPGEHITGVFSFDSQKAINPDDLTHLLVPRAQRLLLPYYNSCESSFEQDEAYRIKEHAKITYNLDVTPLPIDDATLLYHRVNSFIDEHDAVTGIEGTALILGYSAIIKLAMQAKRPFISTSFDLVEAAPFSYGVDPAHPGRAAFAILQKILAGQSPATIPVTQVFGARDLFINIPMCHRCGVSDDDIQEILRRIEHDPAFALLKQNDKVHVMPHGRWSDLDEKPISA